MTSEPPGEDRRNGHRSIREWFKHLVFLAALALVGFLGESGKDGGFIKDIWQALKTASPPVAMVLFVLFLDERRERRDAQKQCNDRTIDFILSTNLQTTTGERASRALSEVAQVLRSVVATVGIKLSRKRARK